MEKRAVITVDGLAGAGKTALAQMLAERIGFVHLKSGLLYRAVGFLALKERVDFNDASALVALLKGHSVQLAIDPKGGSIILIDGRDVGGDLFQPEVSEAGSLAASQPEVRTALIPAQRQAFPGRGLVAEGRDQGTVIFPDAALKFFVHAEVGIRVQRRMMQLYGADDALSTEMFNSLKKEMEIEIIARDRRDSERAVAPTVPAPDAILIDNSSRTLTQVVQSMYDLAASRGLVRGSFP